MKSLGENPTENELQRIINTVDVDGKSACQHFHFYSTIVTFMSEDDRGDRNRQFNSKKNDDAARLHVLHTAHSALCTQSSCCAR